MSLPSEPIDRVTNGSLARRFGFKVAKSDAAAPGVLAGSVRINRDAMIRYLREIGKGAEVDAILAKDAAGGYANENKENA